jgi:hypothetical protein
LFHAAAPPARASRAIASEQLDNPGDLDNRAATESSRRPGKLGQPSKPLSNIDI